jgi:hypothetical protein
LQRESVREEIIEAYRYQTGRDDSPDLIPQRYRIRGLDRYLIAVQVNSDPESDEWLCVELVERSGLDQVELEDVNCGKTAQDVFTPFRMRPKRKPISSNTTSMITI